MQTIFYWNESELAAESKEGAVGYFNGIRHLIDSVGHGFVFEGGSAGFEVFADDCYEDQRG